MGFSGLVIPRSLEEHPYCLLCKASVVTSQEFQSQKSLKVGHFFAIGFLSNIFCTSGAETLYCDREDL